jgi:hypothetical protein
VRGDNGDANDELTRAATRRDPDELDRLLPKQA